MKYILENELWHYISAYVSEMENIFVCLLSYAVIYGVRLLKRHKR